MRTLLFLCCLLPFIASGQNQGRLESARAQYEMGDYPATIRTLKSDRQLVAVEPEAALLLAVSLFHTNALTEARAILDGLIERKGDNFAVARFYRGRVFHAQNLFVEAAAEYKTYLRTLRPDGEAWRTVTNLLRNVDNGLRLGVGGSEIVVDNLGPSVNTVSDEFGAIPSPTGSDRVYYTKLIPARRAGEPGQVDIYVTRTEGNAWATGTSLNPLLNTGAQESISDISPDGSRLYYFRGEGEAGRFLIDTFRADAAGEMVTIPLDVPLSSAATDVTPHFGAPGVVYFASSRPGGYGGLDLYRRRLLPTGAYGPPENLGPRVNSRYDEICPFLAKDTRTLYYSTNNPEYSIGGFDVLSSYRVIGSDNQFTQGSNVGAPVNSPGDDTHFRLAPDTFTAFLTSDRKDGYGRRDLYVVYYPLARPEMQ